MRDALDMAHRSSLEIPGDLRARLEVARLDLLALLLPSATARFRKQLPSRAHPTLELLEASIRPALSPKEAYSMVPGRDPESV